MNLCLYDIRHRRQRLSLLPNDTGSPVGHSCSEIFAYFGFHKVFTFKVFNTYFLLYWLLLLLGWVKYLCLPTFTSNQGFFFSLSFILHLNLKIFLTQNHRDTDQKKKTLSNIFCFRLRVKEMHVQNSAAQ